MKRTAISRRFLNGARVVAALALCHLAAVASYANPCTSDAGAAHTWSSCGGVIPTGADTVKIIGGHTITVDASNALATSVKVGGVPAVITATLRFNSASQLTVSGTLRMGGQNVNTHGTLDMTNGGTLITGSLLLATPASTKTWTPGTGTVELKSTNTLPSTVFTSFNNLTTNDGTTTLAAPMTKTGNLLISAGALVANNSNSFIGKYDGGSWTYPTVGNRTSTSTQVTGLTSFSDFQIGAPPTYVLSGHVQNSGSVAIVGVTVSLSGGQSSSTTTDASGNYSFANLTSGSNYTVTPSQTNYAFSPVNLSYDNLTASQTAADFAGTNYSGHAPVFGAAESFAVLGGTTVTNTGLTVVSGNLGVSPGTAVTGFGPGVIQNGAIYSGAGSLAGPAQASALTAYQDLVAQQCLPANNLSGKVLGVDSGAVTLGPGIYCFDAAGVLTGTLTLNDGGDPNALFIFKLGTTLTIATSAQVVMSSGGRGANVYWQIGTSATVGASTALRGNLIANTSITLVSGASTTGRVFALNGAVTMDTNAVDAVPATIPTPNIALIASVNPTGSLQPRTDLVYTINFSNNGADSALVFVITDPIPANTDFKVGSITNSLGTTGLTATVAYSSDHGATWTYTPASGGGTAPAGYDRNVTNVRWNFASTLSQTAPNNTGSVSFSARIR